MRHCRGFHQLRASMAGARPVRVRPVCEEEPNHVEVPSNPRLRNRAAFGPRSSYPFLLFCSRRCHGREAGELRRRGHPRPRPRPFRCCGGGPIYSKCAQSDIEMRAIVAHRPIDRYALVEEPSRTASTSPRSHARLSLVLSSVSLSQRAVSIALLSRLCDAREMASTVLQSPKGQKAAKK